MKNKLKKNVMRGLCALAACSMLAAPLTVLADETPEGDEVVISENDKPYLSLGADLTAKQQHTVLDFMGIKAEDLEDYDVSYVSNEEEHEYLGSYISAKKIGKRALSSVVITEAPKGSGLHISTYNINYCTVGMYKNALATAGVTDANIIVAGPFEISGTAALVGVLKAYTRMTGDEISDEVIDASMDELVTTGKLEETLVNENVTAEELESYLAELKQEIAKGNLKTTAEIKDYIKKLADERGIVLSKSEIEEITRLLEKLKSVDIDWDAVANQAKYWAKKLGDITKNISGDDVDSFFGFISHYAKKFLSFLQKLIP